MAIHNCKICGKPFYTRTSGKYCDLPCRLKQYKIQQKIDYERFIKPTLLTYVTIEGLRYNKEEIKQKILPLNRLYV